MKVQVYMLIYWDSQFVGCFLLLQSPPTNEEERSLVGLSVSSDHFPSTAGGVSHAEPGPEHIFAAVLMALGFTQWPYIQTEACYWEIQGKKQPVRMYTPIHTLKRNSAPEMTVINMSTLFKNTTINCKALSSLPLTKDGAAWVRTEQSNRSHRRLLLATACPWSGVSWVVSRRQPACTVIGLLHCSVECR